MKFIATAALCVVVVLAGCTSNSTNPKPNNVSYRASTVGTYILGTYEYYTLDQAGADSVMGGYNDSSVYEGQSSVTDTKSNTKDAANYVGYTAGVARDTTLVSESDGKLYSLFNLNFNLPGISPLMMGTRWVQIGDQNNNTWTAMKDSVKGIQVTYGLLPLTVDAVFDLQGSKVGNETLTIDGASVQAMHYKVMYNLTFSVSTALGSLPVSPLTLPIDYWVVEGVGLVKSTQKPGTITLGPPANQTFVIPGFTYIATKFVKAP